jgi:hypothetical protein
MKPDLKLAQVEPLPRSRLKDQAALEGLPFAQIDWSAQPRKLAIIRVKKDLWPVLQQDERFIARRTKERVVLYDSDGVRIESLEGTRSEVGIPRMLQLRIQDGCFTHNHPSDGGYWQTWYNTLTYDDLLTAGRLNVESARAVTAHGLVFEVCRPPSGWPPKRELDEIRRRYLLNHLRHKDLVREVRARARVNPDWRFVAAHDLMLTLSVEHKARYSVWSYTHG